MNDSPVLSPSAQTVTANKPNRHRGDILFAFGVLLVLYTAWHVRRELVLIYVSALFAVVLMPVLRGIMKFRIGKWSPGRGAAIFILLLAIAAAIAVFALVALPPVIHDLHEFAREMPTRGPQLLSRIRRLPFSQRVNVDALNAKLQDFASISRPIFFSPSATGREPSLTSLPVSYLPFISWRRAKLLISGSLLPPNRQTPAP